MNPKWPRKDEGSSEKPSSQSSRGNFDRKWFHKMRSASQSSSSTAGGGNNNNAITTAFDLSVDPNDQSKDSASALSTHSTVSTHSRSSSKSTGLKFGRRSKSSENHKGDHKGDHKGNPRGNHKGTNFFLSKTNIDENVPELPQSIEPDLNSADSTLVDSATPQQQQQVPSISVNVSSPPQHTPKGSPARTRSSSRNSAASDPDAPPHRKLGKLFLWGRTPSSTSISSHARGNRNSAASSSSTASVPAPATEPPLPVTAAAAAAAGEPQNTIPFPVKRASSGLLTDLPRVMMDSHDSSHFRRRRRTEDSSNRSRSSSLALSFSRRGSTSDGAPVSGGGGGGGGGGSGSGSSLHHYHHRPAPSRRSTSSEDVRLKRVLPLPPPPTIGLGNVLEDPDVRALDLDPLAVRYADHMHMMGYTRNRYICALLARESSKEGAKYNGMVMQAFVMRMLRFHGEPLDMSLRKFLFRMALPQEAQQIERVLYNFSVLWHYQNPDIFADQEQVLYIVFSLVMLHTDVFNKNIKHKISKSDYVRNAGIDGVAPEIFEYFYDNITASPFRSDDEVAPASPASLKQNGTGGSSGSIYGNGSVGGATTFPHPLTSTYVPAPATGLPSDILDDIQESLPLHHNSVFSQSEDSNSLGSRRSSSFTWIRDQPPDPYSYVLENRLDALRPELTSVSSQSPFETWELESAADLNAIRCLLNRPDAPTLQLVSQKSRPDAYLSGTSNEVLEAQARPGVVEVRVVKHGMVLRREARRMVLGGHKPGWREWGVVLTNSRLYLTKNAAWVRQLSDNSNVSMDFLQGASALSTRDMAAIMVTHGSNTTGTRSTRGSGGSGTNGGGSGGGSSSGGGGGGVSNFLNSHHNSSQNLQEESLLDFTLIEGGRDCAQQRFAVRDEAELKSWVQTINGVAVQTSLNIRLEPMSSPEQISAAIAEVDEQLAAVESDIATYRRTLRHFKILAPLHHRTREALVFTAGRYSSKCDDAFAELTRLQAYRNILEMAAAQPIPQEPSSQVPNPQSDPQPDPQPKQQLDPQLEAQLEAELEAQIEAQLGLEPSKQFSQ